MSDEPLKTDLAVWFAPTGDVDLDLSAGDLQRVSGLDNLAQALTLRLLTTRGELEALAHPRYGSRIRELIGEPRDRPNRELLRRFVRKALMEERRVAEVIGVRVSNHLVDPAVLVVEAHVRAIGGESVEVEIAVDLG